MISPAPSSATASAGTVPVPLTALAIDGTPPAAGDDVSFSVAGRIVAIDGEMAQVEVASINDQPMAAGPEADDRAMMDEAMRADADGMA